MESEEPRKAFEMSSQQASDLVNSTPTEIGRDGFKSSLHYILLQPLNSGFSFIFNEFLLLLSNKDIGKLDIALSEKVLHDIFIERIGYFYEYNAVKYAGELEMIVKRKIPLTRCVLTFRGLLKCKRI